MAAIRPQTEPRRPGFPPGQSGNPAGRKRGCKNYKTRIVEQMTAELLDAASAVQAVVVSKAMEGDMAAASLLLSRIMPAVKPRSLPVQFEFDRNATIEENGAAILKAVSEGKIDPETGKSLIDLLSSYVGLRDVNLLLEELRNL